MEEILKVHTAWCSFLRRRAFMPDSTDEDQDVAEVGIRSAIEDMETLGHAKYGKVGHRSLPTILRSTSGLGCLRLDLRS